MTEFSEAILIDLVARVNKVRRWLLALAILKVTAWTMTFALGYICIYAWLDHRLNFEIPGRIIALLLLIAGFAILLYKLATSLIEHISLSGAANFIENRKSFDQQLVTAVEYFEKQQDYPYSKTLAEQLVLQTYRQTEDFKFDSTITKWHGYVFAAVICFGLSVVWFYVRDNYQFFASYFARLTHPLAAIEPMGRLSLEPITKDMVAEPDTDVTFAAAIQGQTPESGKLVLVAVDPNAADDTMQGQHQEIVVRPSFQPGEKPTFKASKSFSQPGLFKYRFETESASTDWHQVNISEAPQIEDITAEVLLPPRPPRSTWVKLPTEKVENQTLEVMPRSSVTLHAQASEPLREVVITGPDGQPFTKQLNGADQFTFTFTAEKNGSVQFRPIDQQGLANDSVPDVQVVLRQDEPPTFKLISPDGDYLTTNVASVPITFEVADDFGLAGAEMCLEMPGQEPSELTIPLTEGQKSKTFTHTLELEQHDLQVGDSILFYATASDIDTGSALASRTSSSEVYFIEIRPYRQNWHPQAGGGQGTGGGSPPEELLNILEYTRAILKKTWALADGSTPTDAERSRLQAINDDIQYCAAQLAAIRDDSEYGFSEDHKAVLNQVLQRYDQASQCLAKHDAAAAVPPEKEAYRILRKFILELELQWSPPSSGQGQMPKKPDAVKLRESPDFSPYEKERIEAELKKMQQRVEKLTREQKLLKTDFVNCLDQQAQEKILAQQVQREDALTKAQDKQAPGKPSAEQEAQQATDQKAEGAPDSTSPGDSQSATSAVGEASAQSESSSEGQSAQGDKGASDSQGSQPGQQGTEAQETAQSQAAQAGKGTSDGERPDGSESAGQGKGRPSPQGQDAKSTDASSESPGPGPGGQTKRQSSASTDARLSMLAAKQNALQEKVAQLTKDLQQLPLGSEQDKAEARQQAQDHLDEAISKMDQFQTEAGETRYKPDMSSEKASQAVELMESARQELDQAGKALEQGLTMTQEQKLANQARKMAEQLAEDADALDESLSPLEKREMLARLEAAKRLLESMSQAQWATIHKSSSRPGTAHVLTQNPALAPAQAARAMARQFWSIAIEAQKRQAELAEKEPSDVRFYELENEFFEDAARFSQESVRK